MSAVVLSEELLRAASISEREVREDVAVLLYRKGLPLGKAASVAQVPRLAFHRILASRNVPLDYDVADLDEDVDTLRRVFPDAGKGA